MMRTRRHLTLIDLMAAVGAAALALGWIVWIAPDRAAPALIVIGPLAGILCDRWRGCRGMLGGALGGAAYAGLLLIWMVTRPDPPLSRAGRYKRSSRSLAAPPSARSWASRSGSWWLCWDDP
jgi:hypothetical protein